MTIIKTSLRAFIKKFLKKIGFFSGSYYINGPDTLPAPLSAEEERRLIKLMSSNDGEAKKELITHNLRLVVYIARKFDTVGAGIEDLISIGTIGLIKAVNTFSPEKGIKLATYASRCIENEILMFLRKTTVLKTEISLDEPLNIDWDGNELLLSDILGSDGEEVSNKIETEDEKKILRSQLSKLNEREQLIMKMRFGMDGFEEMTQKQVADVLGISQSYISRLEKRIIIELKRNIEKAVN